MRTQPIHSFRTRTTLAMAITSAICGPVQALDLTWLTHPSLEGYVTFDGYLGNSDDRVFAGINTIGAASSFIAANDVYGFFQGTHSVRGQSVFGSPTNDACSARIP